MQRKKASSDATSDLKSQFVGFNSNYESLSLASLVHILY